MGKPDLHKNCTIPLTAAVFHFKILWQNKVIKWGATHLTALLINSNFGLNYGHTSKTICILFWKGIWLEKCIFIFVSCLFKGLFCCVFCFYLLNTRSWIWDGSKFLFWFFLSPLYYCEKVVAYFPWILRTGTSKYHSENTKGGLLKKR